MALLQQVVDRLNAPTVLDGQLRNIDYKHFRYRGTAVVTVDVSEDSSGEGVTVDFWLPGSSGITSDANRSGARQTVSQVVTAVAGMKNVSVEAALGDRISPSKADAVEEIMRQLDHYQRLTED